MGGVRGGERERARQRQTGDVAAVLGKEPRRDYWSRLKSGRSGGGECVVSPDRGNTGCTAGSLRDQQAQGHVDFIGFHSFSSEYLLCFCAFVIRPAQAHTHMHTDIHLSMLPLSLSLSLLEWVLCS